MNGYIKIDLNGKDVGLKFNMHALIMLDQRQLSKAYEPGDIRATYEMVYCGILGNAFAKETEVQATFDEVVDWVDGLMFTEEGQKVLLDVVECMKESKAYQSTIKAAERIEDEKKSQSSGIPY